MLPEATFEELGGLTFSQTYHLERAKEAFAKAASAKYKAGCAEHGGNLWDNSTSYLIDEAMKECIDQWMYLFTLKEKLCRLDTEGTTQTISGGR